MQMPHLLLDGELLLPLLGLFSLLLRLLRLPLLPLICHSHTTRYAPSTQIVTATKAHRYTIIFRSGPPIRHPMLTQAVSN